MRLSANPLPAGARRKFEKAKEMIMSIWRTLAGAAAVAAVALVAPLASAATPGVLVTGDNLPANVDPHQIFDVPMQLYSLNTYALTPKLLDEEVQVCEAIPGGGSRPIAPFAGPCPPPH